MKVQSVALLLGALVLASACSHTEPTLSEQLSSDFEQSQSGGSLSPTESVTSQPLDEASSSAYDLTSSPSSSSLGTSSSYSAEAFAPASLSSASVKHHKKAHKRVKKAKKSKKHLAKRKGKKHKRNKRRAH